MTLSVSLAEVDAIFERSVALGSAPGVAYGVVMDGAIVQAGGHGTLRAGDTAPPDVDSVFRIASMTKSFTAAAVLLLRDEGRLRFDDPVARWVPDLADLHGPTADSPPVTIGHLLTMAAGFPSDDPWGDRQQGLGLAEFADLLRGGLAFAWAPGTHFEYSNLGYGILGRVITNISGVEYRDFVQGRLLAPLGMTATTFEQEDVPAARLAHGYVRRDDAWLEEPIDPYGALASMGGIFTSVRDLARWVAGFTDAFPPRDEPEAEHPLTRASRREMQQIHRSFDPELTWSAADATPELLSGGYGYGLFVSDDLRLGRVVGHGGGYPGFGSHMRWHPTSGTGVIAFGNARYARMDLLVREALAGLLAREPGRIRSAAPWPQTIDARARVERLLTHWDDADAADLFAMNVDLDEPLALRRATIERLHHVHGALTRDGTTAPESDTPAAVSWWMTGERGRIHVQMTLSPERPPLVQSLLFRSVPEPPAGLTAIAVRLVAVLGTPGPAWPSGIDLADSLDRDRIARSLRAAEARFGPVILGVAIGGDGETTARWRLHGDRGDIDLALGCDYPDGPLTLVEFVPRALTTPRHAM